MLSAIGNVGQNNYNTSFGCKKSASKLLEDLSKKTPQISQEVRDSFSQGDSIAKEMWRCKTGKMSENEIKEISLHEAMLKSCNDSLLDSFNKCK